MTIDEKAELYTGSQAREDALVTFLVTSIVQSPSNIQTIRENAAKQQTDTKVIKDNIQQETVNYLKRHNNQQNDQELHQLIKHNRQLKLILWKMLHNEIMLLKVNLESA